MTGIGMCNFISAIRERGVQVLQDESERVASAVACHFWRFMSHVVFEKLAGLDSQVLHRSV